MKCVVALSIMMMLAARISGRVIIFNEQAMFGYCSADCNHLPTLYNKEGCKTITNCKWSADGYDYWFRRCSYCECECDTGKELGTPVTTKITINKQKLYTACNGACNQKKGIVRTNLEGCQEIANCEYAAPGWLYIFQIYSGYCDYCNCDCVNYRTATKYTIKDIKYDMNAAHNMKEKQPTAFGSANVENQGVTEQMISRTITYSFTRTTTVETSHTLQVGITVSVEAGFNIGIASLKASVSTSLTYGFTYTSGEIKSETNTDSVTASVKVAGRTSKRVTLVGYRYNTNIPFTATLVTTWSDGKNTTSAITGTYTNVDFSDFNVQYEAAVNL